MSRLFRESRHLWNIYGATMGHAWIRIHLSRSKKANNAVKYEVFWNKEFLRNCTLRRGNLCAILCIYVPRYFILIFLNKETMTTKAHKASRGTNSPCKIDSARYSKALFLNFFKPFTALIFQPLFPKRELDERCLTASRRSPIISNQ